MKKANKITKASTAKKISAANIIRKKIDVDKPLGVFVIVCGLLGLIVFVTLGVGSLFE